MDEWSKEIIEAKDRRALPVLYFPCLSPLTGMGVIETVKDGKKMAQNMKAIVEQYSNMIAAMTGMDLTVDSEAFGAEVTFKETEAPSVAYALLKSAEDIETLEVPDVHSGRVDVFLEACVEAQKFVTVKKGQIRSDLTPINKKEYLISGITKEIDTLFFFVLFCDTYSIVC